MAEALRENQTSSLNETLTNSSAVSVNGGATESPEFKYTKVTFYFLILFCATFGNAMVIYVICTSKRMRSASHLLIMNLAVCDFFTPLISIPFDFALEENDYAWFYGDLMCKILYPAATFSTTASSLTLAAISLDRYRLLMHPFKKKLSKNQIIGIIIGIYTFCAALVSPYTYVLNVEDGSCGEKWPKLYRQSYTMALFLFQYAIPLAFMTVMYSLAIRNLYSTSGKVRHCSIQSNMRHYVNDPPGDNEPNVKTRRGYIKAKLTNLFQKRRDSMEENPNVKATKMFMAVVVVFAVFMFPNQVLWLWVDFGNGSEQPNYAQSAIICWLFTYTNSVVNPIIFAIFSKDFRVGFKGVFRLIFCCNQEALPERCYRLDCHTKSDSSTNEILKEKDKQTYDVSPFNTNVVDSDLSLAKGNCSRYQSLLYAARDMNYNTGLKRVCGEPKPILNVYPIAHTNDDTVTFPGKFQNCQDNGTLDLSKKIDTTFDNSDKNAATFIDLSDNKANIEFSEEKMTIEKSKKNVASFVETKEDCITSNISSKDSTALNDDKSKEDIPVDISKEDHVSFANSILNDSIFRLPEENNTLFSEKDATSNKCKTAGINPGNVTNVLPMLPPNTIDILQELPETSC